MIDKPIRLILPLIWAVSVLVGAPTRAGAQTDPSRLEGFHDNAQDKTVFRVLEMAHESIDIEIYEMADQDVRRLIRQSLHHQPRPIRVRIIKEPNPVGEKCHYFKDISEDDDDDCKDQKALVREVRASAGGKFVPFKKAELCGGYGRCFEHGKLILIDGRHALLSTGNFNSTSLCNLSRDPGKCNRDFSYVISDPEEVGVLTEIFERDLSGAYYDLLPLLARSKRLTVSPYSLDPLVRFIKQAKRSVRIENQYLQDPEINAALIEVSARKKNPVKVYATVSSLCSFGPPRALSKDAKNMFKAFEDARISLHFFTAQMHVGGKPGYLHAKAIVIDDTHAWLGSVNGSVTATSANREFGIFFHNPPDVKKLVEILDKDYKDERSDQSLEETLGCTNDYESRPRVRREKVEP